MRSLVLIGLLLVTSVARADDTHDGGFDTGAKLALAGGITFGAIYSATAMATGIGDSLCGLGESPDSCNHPHTNLYIPLVGGFLPGRDDWSQPWGIASSILQISSVGVMVAGLALHHRHAKH